jgi:hypothetical protein
MVGLGIAFGAVVVLAGLLIMVGLMRDHPVLLGLGFLLMALCAIYGVQPGFPGGRTSAD